MKTDAEPVEVGSTSREIYVSASDLAVLLKISDNEVSRLSRSGVLVRVPHPEDSRAFLYPLLESVTAYVTHVRSARENLTSVTSRKTGNPIGWHIGLRGRP